MNRCWFGSRTTLAATVTIVSLTAVPAGRAQDRAAQASGK